MLLTDIFGDSARIRVVQALLDHDEWLSSKQLERHSFSKPSVVRNVLIILLGKGLVVEGKGKALGDNNRKCIGYKLNEKNGVFDDLVIFHLSMKNE